MVKGGVGSNQYQTKPGSGKPSLPGPVAAQPPQIDAKLAAYLEQHLPTALDKRLMEGKVRCGEVWGTRCKTLVGYPLLAHGKHPSPRSMHETIAWGGRGRRESVIVLHSVFLLLQTPDYYWHRTMRSLAFNENVPEYLLREIASWDNLEAKASLLENESLPPDIVDSLVRDLLEKYTERCANALLGGVGVLFRAMANNPNVWPSTLKFCIHRLGTWEQERLLAHPNMPVDILVEFSEHRGSHKLRAVVARNPSTPPEVLRSMADREKGATVAGNLAENPNTPPEALAKLVLSKQPGYVIQTALENPNCPDYIRAIHALGS